MEGQEGTGAGEGGSEAARGDRKQAREVGESSRGAQSIAPELTKLLERVRSRIREGSWVPGPGLVELQAELRQFLRVNLKERSAREMCAPRWKGMVYACRRWEEAAFGIVLNEPPEHAWMGSDASCC